jgi:hypothetical protein
MRFEPATSRLHSSVGSRSKKIYRVKMLGNARMSVIQSGCATNGMEMEMLLVFPDSENVRQCDFKVSN